jgi:hypothetical protein
MTFLIAVLIIKNFNMQWWWYGIAGITWAIHLKIAFRDRSCDKYFDNIRKKDFEVHDKVLAEMEE